MVVQINHEEIERLATEYGSVRGISLNVIMESRQRCIVVSSCGRVIFVITMDADLQDSPMKYQPLQYDYQANYDLVSGWKEALRSTI